MTWLKEVALPVLGKGVDWLVSFLKWALAKLKIVFDTVYDPPPRTIRFFFWSAMAGVLVVWCFFAFTQSWFYRPTVEALSSFSWSLGGDDLDVVISEPLAPVTVSPPEVPGTLVCEDMSDTPHCVDVPPKAETGGTVEVSDLPPPVAKPKATTVKSSVVRKRRKFKPYETVWGF